MKRPWAKQAEKEAAAGGTAGKVGEGLLEHRIVMLTSSVDAESADEVISKLLYLEKKNPGAPIELFINSPGGEISSGLAIYDVIRYISSPVTTIACGLTASIATIILIAAEKGRRKALPHARLLIHQPLAGFKGTASDIEIQMKEIQKLKLRLNEMLAEATGQPLERIERDTDRDYWMSAEEALEYGLIDEII